MPATRVMIFDDGLGVFTPLTDLRAVFELRTGMQTTLKRIESLTGLKVAALQVPEHLHAVVASRYPKIPVNEDLAQAGEWLIVNGRCADTAVIKQIANLESGQLLQDQDKTLVAARMSLSRSWDLPAGMRVQTLEGQALLTRVWQIHTLLDANLLDDMARCSIESIKATSGLGKLSGVTVFGEHDVKIHPSARLQPGVILNAEAGPIVIGADVLIESPAVVQGPCAICRGSMIAPMTQLRGDTVIGPVCKVGGEIKSTIIAGYSNKAHAGYLGNALVGYWVNLGADTTASNLKNTYSPVRMQLGPNEPREDTGLSNLGPIIGDYVRTGITTAMPTGTVIGTGTMIAQSTFTPTCVPPMGFITDRQAAAYDAEKLIESADAMMSRRDQKLTEAEKQRLTQLANNWSGLYS